MKWMRNRSLVALSLSALLITAGCGSNAATNQTNGGPASASPSAQPSSASTGDKLVVKTSFYPMYEFTRHVAGDLAEVENLVPAGVEPHDWEPTPKDMAKITEADVLVFNGAGMEAWVDQVLDSVVTSKLKVIEASKGLEIMEGSPDHHDHGHVHSDEHSHTEGEQAHEEEHTHAEGEHSHEDEHTHTEGEHSHEEEHTHSEGEHTHEDGHTHAEGEHSHEEGHTHAEGEHAHDHGGMDPHVWLSPALAIKEVENIEAGLSEAAPEHKEAFHANAEAYIAELKKLDEDFRSQLADVKRKDFITQHAAFGYLAKEYGLTQVPIAGLSPDQEPSAEQMAQIVEFAKEHKVQWIFFETLVSSRVADTIANEIGAKTLVLNPIEGLTEDEQAKGLDYIGVMRKNLDSLKQALTE
ncbi:metal ABC transporter substrate-binding protein [Paenibacillus sp. CN-4]|uniref:metal ABC transporter substrate-binding protein n=1 Tax=Paenibacillus nanchangensis TaxID=3348343 RepID=UPI0039794052